jgi:hypothetical protein
MFNNVNIARAKTAAQELKYGTRGKSGLQLQQQLQAAQRSAALLRPTDTKSAGSSLSSKSSASVSSNARYKSFADMVAAKLIALDRAQTVRLRVVQFALSQLYSAVIVCAGTGSFSMLLMSCL